MRRPWLSEEPPLTEVIGDPVIAMMMRTDGVTLQALWAAIRAARRRLDTQTMPRGERGRN